MSRSLIIVILLTLTITLGFTLRLAHLQAKSALSHDEAVSYIAATGHIGEYDAIVANESYPYGSWAPASAWKRLLLPDRQFCFAQIGFDLSHFDIHPPLYFWILHLWTLIFGVDPHSGPILNILLSGATALCLFLFAHQVLADSVLALLVSAVWYLSPASIPSALEARHYELFGLVTVLFMWRLSRVIQETERSGVCPYIALATISAAGALTHYQFSVLVLACLASALLVFVILRHDLWRMLRTGVAVGFGYLIFYLLHRDFLLSFGRAAKQFPGTPAWRWKPILECLAAFFGHLQPFWPVLLLLAALTPVWLWLRGSMGKSAKALTAPSNLPALFVATTALLTTSLLFFLYSRAVIPQHAIGGKYLVVLWPSLSFVPALIIRTPGKPQRILTYLLIAWILLYAGTVALRKFGNGAGPNPIHFPRCPRVLVDNVARGILPQILWPLEEDIRVFAAPQDFLLKNQGRWIDRVHPGDVYVSQLVYGNTKRGRQAILDLLCTKNSIALVPNWVWNFADLFRLEKRTASSHGCDYANLQSEANVLSLGEFRSELRLQDAPAQPIVLSASWFARFERWIGLRKSLTVRVIHAGGLKCWPRSVYVGTIWLALDAKGKRVREPRIGLPHVMFPGDEVDVRIPLDPSDSSGRPLPAGKYQIWISLIQENVAWLHDRGGPLVKVDLQIVQ